eukprot:gene11060-7871_t
MQRLGVSAQSSLEEFIKNIFISTKGDDLSELKCLMDSKGDLFSMHYLVFVQLRNPSVRQSILDHIAKQAKIQGALLGSMARRRNMLSWRKVLSDIDDTLVSSGGSFPKGVDTNFPKQSIYPGVLAFYRELNLGTSGEDAVEKLRHGDLAFISARPHVYKDVSESTTYNKIRKLQKDRGLHTTATLLAGSLDTGSRFLVTKDSEALAQKKYENFKEYLRIYPEFTCVFVGDNGQGDVRAAELVMGDKDIGSLLTRTYVHVVQGIEETFVRDSSLRTYNNKSRICYFNTYVDAAIDAYESGLIRKTGLQRLMAESVRDFFMISDDNWGMMNTETIRPRSFYIRKARLAAKAEAAKSASVASSVSTSTADAEKGQRDASKYPTTSVPTIPGITNDPSNYPTGKPTYNVDNYRDSLAWKYYQSNLTAVSSESSNYVFGTFFYKGETKDGTCDRWLDFSQNQVRIPYDDIVVTHVSFWSYVYDYRTRSPRIQRTSCDNVNSISGVVPSLNSGLDYSFTCNSASFRLFSCGGNVVFCMNCKRNCVKTVSCPGNSFIVNPCQSGCNIHAALGSVVNIRYAKVPKYPRYFKAPHVTMRTRSSLTVTANFTGSGTWTCAAFPFSTNVSSVDEISRSGSIVQVPTARGNFTVTLAGLSPDSSYKVLCVTASFASHIMPFSEALQYQTVAKTACCKAISFTARYPIVTVSSGTSATSANPADLLDGKRWVVSLDATPTSPVTVQLNISSTNNCSSDVVIVNPSLGRAVAVPSRLVFPAGTKQLQQEFVVIGSIGCFVLSAFTNNRAETYQNTSYSFAILSKESVVPAPSAVSVVLSDEGSRLFVSFSAATNTPSPLPLTSRFPCHYLMNFDLVNGTTCLWMNSTLLTVYLSSAALVYPGWQVTLIRGRIRAACTSTTPSFCDQQYSFMPRTVLTIASPVNPVTPVVALNIPQSVMGCDDLIMDATGSSGHVGRDWLSVVWAVTGSLHQSNLSVIETYMNTYATNVRSMVSVPRAQLFPDFQPRTLTFQLTLTNYLGVSGVRTATTTFRYDGIARPRLFIYGPPVSVQSRFLPLTLFANATYPACASNANRTIQYIWTVFTGMTLVSSLVSTSADPRYFVLPAYQLEPGETYTVQVRVSFDLGTPRSVSLTSLRTVQVARGAVKALIGGGVSESYRLRDTLKFNASRSFELDYPDKVPSSSLTYKWECVQRFPDFGGSCGTNNYFPSSAPYWQIPAYYLDEGIFDVSLTVSNSYGFRDVAQMTINITERFTPGVTLNHTASLTFNSGDKIILTGSVLTDGQAAYAQWQCPSISSSVLSSIATTPTSLTVPSGSFGSLFLAQLALEPYALPDGGVFTFELIASYSSGLGTYGMSAVEVRINDPPLGGVMDVSPATGYAFATRYLLATSLWTDSADSLPLTYTFACHTLDASQAYIVKDRDEVVFATALLGQGLRTNAWTVYCFANATDVYNGVGMAEDSTQVFPPQGTPSSTPTTVMIDAFSSSIEAAFAQQNPIAATQLISSALSVLNTVNCAVPTRCSLLNRHVCGLTPGTCGPCQAGFYGLPGDANTPCNASLSLLGRVGESCRSNATCITGLCRQRQCASAPKDCPASCNGRGTCTWVEVMTGQAVSFCAVDDDTCIAVCRCQSNRYGRDCSLFGSQYDQSKAFRLQLCQQLQRTVDVQDVSQASLQARAMAVAQILIDPSVLDGATIATCAQVLLDTVNADPTIACEQNGANLVVSTMNAMMLSFSARNVYGIDMADATRYDLIRGVSQVLQTVGQQCLATQAVGEDPLFLSLDSVRLSSYAVGSVSLPSTVFQAAQSPYQQYVQVAGDTAKTAVPKFTLADDVSVLTSQDSMGVTVLQYNNHPQQTAGKNNSIVYISATVSNKPQQRDVISLNKRRLSLPLGSIDVAVDEAVAVADVRRETLTVELEDPALVDFDALLSHDDLRSWSEAAVDAPPPYERYLLPLPEVQFAVPSVSAAPAYADDVDQSRRLQSRRLVTEETVLPMAMTLTLPNVAPVYYNAFPNITITLKCHRYQDTAYTVNRTCPTPGGPFVEVTCPARAKGIYNVTCPYREYRPVCLSSTDGGVSFAEDSNCRVSQFSADNTTCVCESVKGTTSLFVDAATGRRLASTLADGETVMVQFTTSYRLFTLPTEADWLPYPPLLEVQDNVAISTTLYVCFALSAAGLLIFFLYDRYDYNAWQPVQDKQHSTRTVRSIRRFFREMVLPPDFLLQHRPQDVYQRSALSDAQTAQTAADTVITRGIDEPWRRLFVRRLWAEHSLLSLWAPSSFSFSPMASAPGAVASSGDANVMSLHRHQPLVRSVTWLQVMTKFLAVMCLDTVATSLFYADDGTCGALPDMDSCERERNAYVPRLHPQQCVWRSDNLSCIYNRPAVTFPSVVVFTLIVSVCARPLHRLVEILCARCSKAVHQHLMRSATKAKRRAHDLQQHPSAASHARQPPLFAMGKALLEKRGLVAPQPYGVDGELDRSPSTAARAKLAGGPAVDNDDALMMVLAFDQSTSKHSVDDLAYLPGDATTLPAQMKSFAAVHRVDELSDCQSVPAKLLRSARLMKMQQEIDYLLPTQEVDKLLLDQQRQYFRYGRRELLVADETVDWSAAGPSSAVVLSGASAAPGDGLVLFAKTAASAAAGDNRLGDLLNVPAAGADARTVTLPASQPVVLSDTPRHNRYAASMLLSVGSPADSLVAATVAITLPDLVRKVEAVRRQAEFIKERLDGLGRHLGLAEALYAQDVYLFQRFLVHLYPDYRAKWLSRFVFFGSQQQQDYTAWQRWWRAASFAVGLPLLWVAFVYVILWLNTDIGSRASGLWAAVLVLTLVVDYAVAEPFQIWWQWMVVVQTSGLRRDVSKLVYALERRFEYLVSRRVDGLMTDRGHALLQHFNPACRIARLYPHLPIARLLLSLNDYDVPLWAIRGVSSSLPTSVQAGGVGVRDASGSFHHLFTQLRQQFSSRSASVPGAGGAYASDAAVEDVDPVLETGLRGAWRRFARKWAPLAVEFFATLPYSVQDTCIDLLALGAAMGAAIVFYLFAVEASVAAAVVVAALLVVLVVLRETRVLPSLNPTQLLLSVGGFGGGGERSAASLERGASATDLGMIDLAPCRAPCAARRRRPAAAPARRGGQKGRRLAAPHFAAARGAAAARRGGDAVAAAARRGSAPQPQRSPRLCRRRPRRSRRSKRRSARCPSARTSTRGAGAALPSTQPAPEARPASASPPRHAARAAPSPSPSPQRARAAAICRGEDAAVDVPVHVAPSVPLLPLPGDPRRAEAATAATGAVQAHSDEQLRAMQRAAQRAAQRNARLVSQQLQQQSVGSDLELQSLALDEGGARSAAASPARPQSAAQPASGRSDVSQSEQALAVHRERVRRRRERTRHSSEADDGAGPGRRHHRRSGSHRRHGSASRERQTPQHSRPSAPAAEPVSPRVAQALQSQVTRAAFSPPAARPAPGAASPAVAMYPDSPQLRQLAAQAPWQSRQLMPYMQVGADGHVPQIDYQAPLAQTLHQRFDVPAASMGAAAGRARSPAQTRPQFPSWHAA